MDNRTWTETHAELIAAESIIRWFDFGYMLPHLQPIGKMYADAALELMKLPRGPDRAVALRKLLESRDSAIRAAILRGE